MANWFRNQEREAYELDNPWKASVHSQSASFERSEGANKAVNGYLTPGGMWVQGKFFSPEPVRQARQSEVKRLKEEDDKQGVPAVTHSQSMVAQLRAHVDAMRAKLGKALLGPADKAKSKFGHGVQQEGEGVASSDGSKKSDGEKTEASKTEDTDTAKTEPVIEQKTVDTPPLDPEAAAEAATQKLAAQNSATEEQLVDASTPEDKAKPEDKAAKPEGKAK